MTYIPDCRTDDTYNERYLNKMDREFVRGYDWCVETAVDSFFDNDMDELQDEFSYLGHILNEELPGIMQIEYEYVFADGTIEKRKIKTYADLIRSKILDWVEMERDQLITSMIDGMGDEYEEIKERVDNDRGRKGE